MNEWTLLVLLVAAPADKGDDAVEAMAEAAHEALGPEAAIVVRRLNEAPSEDEALRLARAERAHAVAQVVRTDAPRPKIALHVHPRHAPRWIDRELLFARADVPSEEWRTVGFALASMVPERATVTAALAGNDAARPVGEVRAPAERDATPATAPDRPQRFAFDVAAVGAGRVYADEGNVGAMVAGHYYFAPHFGIRAGAALRTAEAEVEGGPEARSLFAEGALGVAWRSDPHPRAGDFAFGARTDFVLTAQKIWRDATSAPEMQRDRVVPGMALVGEATWAFSDFASVLVGAGGQVAFRSSPVRLGADRVTTMAPLAPLFQTGLRARF